MANYEVLMSWTNQDGEHEQGDVVELTPEGPAEEYEIAKLVERGIIAEMAEEPKKK